MLSVSPVKLKLFGITTYRSVVLVARLLVAIWLPRSNGKIAEGRKINLYNETTNCKVPLLEHMQLSAALHSCHCELSRASRDHARARLPLRFLLEALVEKVVQGAHYRFRWDGLVINRILIFP